MKEHLESGSRFVRGKSTRFSAIELGVGVDLCPAMPNKTAIAESCHKCGLYGKDANRTSKTHGKLINCHGKVV